MFTFDLNLVEGATEYEWQTMSLGQAMLLIKESTGMTSLSQIRAVLTYNLGDGRQFPTRMIGQLIREWHEQASP